MQRKEIKRLIKKYQKGIATDEERAFLESWYLHHNTFESADLTEEALVEDSEVVWKKLHARKKRDVLKIAWPWVAAAACFLLFTLLIFRNPVAEKIEGKRMAKIQSAVIIPGSNKAVLTLADGEKTILSDSLSANFGKQGNTLLSKTADGKLLYRLNPDARTAEDKPVYNEVTTPNGGQYGIVLSDGTKVFLNAGSSLRFPVTFTRSERKVELTGEAYFEVVNDNRAPFNVVTGNQTIAVLGTKFNVNAYSDERFLKTTLLEGAVRVSNATAHVVLKPGQQSQVGTKQSGGQISVLDQVNLAEVSAWRNGLFEFNKTGIKEVMQAASRWYDVHVLYENGVPDLEISGRISRQVDFKSLIALLEFEGVKFDIKGRNVTIKNE